MEIKKVAYENFRNIAEAEVAFTPGTNVLWGNNAQGKTNILEGIYFFARGKSFRASSTERPCASASSAPAPS